MVVLSFQDNFTIKVIGTGSLAEELEQYYDRISSATTDRQINLECRIGSFDCDPDRILGKPTDYYGRRGEWFLRVDKHKKIRIKKDWSEIHFSSEVPKSWAFKLLEYCARQKLAECHSTLIHASGAQIGEVTLAFPAWRHTGKTNTLMTLIQECDADYLSDDRLWFHADGTVNGFPLPINLQPYNYNSFPNIEPPTQFYDQRYRLSNQIRDVTSDTGSFLSQALYFVNEFYITPPSKKAQIEELYPEIKHVEEGSLDALVCLQTVEVGSEDVELTEIGAKKAATYLKSISHHEWNGMMEDYVQAIDLLFDDVDAEKTFKELRNSEWNIWTSSLSEVDTYLLTIPREEEWREKNLSSEVLKELSPIIDT